MNPALTAFLAAFDREMAFAQVLIRRDRAGFELRHIDDRASDPAALQILRRDELRALAQFTAAGAFPALPSTLVIDDASLIGNMAYYYGGAVYHHGAGFRPDKCSRADIADLKAGRSPIIDRCAHSIGRLLQRNPIRALRPQTALHRIIAKNGLLSEEIFERIKNDRDFHRSFAGGH